MPERIEALTRTAQYSLDPKARVTRDPDGVWTLELPRGKSEIGHSFEEARDSLTILINASRHRDE
jgi:hypothetical protein